MKKMFLPAAALLLVLASCGGKSSFESDVRKMADYRCKIEKLSAKAATDPSAQKDMESLMKEMQEFSEKMEKKYESKKNDKDMEEKADKIMDEVMAKCK